MEYFKYISCLMLVEMCSETNLKQHISWNLEVRASNSFWERVERPRWLPTQLQYRLISSSTQSFSEISDWNPNKWWTRFTSPCFPVCTPANQGLVARVTSARQKTQGNKESWSKSKQMSGGDLQRTSNEVIQTWEQWHHLRWQTVLMELLNADILTHENEAKAFTENSAHSWVLIINNFTVVRSTETRISPQILRSHAGSLKIQFPRPCNPSPFGSESSPNKGRRLWILFYVNNLGFRGCIPTELDRTK